LSGATARGVATVFVGARREGNPPAPVRPRSGKQKRVAAGVAILTDQVLPDGHGISARAIGLDRFAVWIASAG
jgi:hypothetical protein